MSKKISLTTILCGLFMCMAVVLCFPAMNAEAASKPACAKKLTVRVKTESSDPNDPKMWQSFGPNSYLYIKNLASNAEIKSVKSNNKKVTATSEWEYGIPAIHIEGAKPGTTATITVKVKQNNKTYTLKSKVTFKQTKDFSSVKIGSKNYTTKANKCLYVYISKPSGSVKISVKPNSGVKVTAITWTHGTGSTSLKNGASVNLSKGDTIMIGYKYTVKPKNYKKVKGQSTEPLTSFVRFCVE